jgi:hypothetical protein
LNVKKIATRIVGYMLEDNVEKLAIEDVRTKVKEVLFWLA